MNNPKEKITIEPLKNETEYPIAYRLAQEIHATDPETMYRVLENLSVDPLTPEQRIKCITMTLKSARRENSSNPAVKKV